MRQRSDRKKCISNIFLNLFDGFILSDNWSGIITSAIDIALDHNVSRLQDDHDNALLLQQGLMDVEELNVSSARTNILYVDFNETSLNTGGVVQYLMEHNIRIPAGRKIRLVTHMDISKNDITYVVKQFKNALVHTQR